MAELIGKRFDSPDEVRKFTDGKGQVDLVDLNGHAIGLGTFEP
ncbi:MAG: cupin, partial [Solirubrobacterales bacterium]|nr:cupin [Solirubrobacterales bacterium]